MKEKLSTEFYKDLYKQIIEQSRHLDYDRDTHDMELQVGEFAVDLTAIFEDVLVDDSFDHAFGIEQCSHHEWGRLEEIQDVNVWLCNNDDPIDVSDEFDYSRFYDVLPK